MDFFEKISLAPIDPIFGVNLAYKSDLRAQKINLGAGVYRDHSLQPYLLESVNQAEKHLVEKKLPREYLPIEGDPLFLEAIKSLVFGKKELEKIAVVQTVGGTGALRSGGQFLVEHVGRDLYLPTPTWDNHTRIFQQAGAMIHPYPYYSDSLRDFDFAAFRSFLLQLPEKAIVLLHACCHNPTGFDPNEKQWQEICRIMKERSLFPFFDFAYQGFGKGLEEDAAVVRLFHQEGVESLVATSFSKNFGLYAERTGALFAICKTPEQAVNVFSQLKIASRGLISNPPCHGAWIVAYILRNPVLRTLWESEVNQMRERIEQMREKLVQLLLSSTSSRSRWEWLQKQKGMFSYTGLSEAQVNQLREEFAIFLPRDGRLNIAGLSTTNVGVVANALLAVTKYPK